ncbi:hypothetical protein D3C87_2120690 [compost metagenome]
MYQMRLIIKSIDKYKSMDFKLLAELTFVNKTATIFNLGPKGQFVEIYFAGVITIFLNSIGP